MSAVIRSRCPQCGGAIIVSELYQYSFDYKVLKSGKLSKKYKRFDGGSMECHIASCEKLCGAEWSSEDFLIDENENFIDLKYTEVTCDEKQRERHDASL